MKYFDFCGETIEDVYSIERCAVKLYNLYHILAKIDKIFNRFYIVISNKKSISVDINSLTQEQGIQNISDAILQANMADIKRHDKLYCPTENYKRNYGFSCYLVCGFDDFRIHHILGNLKCNIFNTTISPRFNRDFDWCFRVLKIFVQYLSSLEARVKISGSSYIKDTINYKYPLGWINYFSNDLALQIPDNLEGFEYEYTENGKYLIATRDDFTISKEAYQEQKEKLFRTMEYLGKTVPGYIIK